MAYQFVANEVMKTPTTKNYAIVCGSMQNSLANYLLKSPTISKDHHIVVSLLEVVMEKIYYTLPPNCQIFVIGSKLFVRSSMWTMENIMALKDHSAYKFVNGSRFHGQSKRQGFCCQNVFLIFLVVVWSL